MGCVTLVVAYDQHDQKSGDLHFWERMGNSFCMDPYAGDSKVADSRPNQVRALGYSKAGKVEGCLKLEEGQGQKISIKGAERNAPAKVEVGERRRTNTTVGDQPNWQLGRATMPSLWRGKSMLVIQGPQRGRAATSQTPNWKD